jgi:hypothetical protein
MREDCLNLELKKLLVQHTESSKLIELGYPKDHLSGIPCLSGCQHCKSLVNVKHEHVPEGAYCYSCNVLLRELSDK